MPSSPKRILHFIESGGLYGAEQVILNLSLQMQDQGQFRPVVGCIVAHPDEPSDLYDAACALGIEALKLVIPNSRLFIALPRTARKLREQNIALMHAHGYKPSVYGFVLRKMTGIQITATCHLWFEMHKGPLKTRVMVRLEKYFYRWFPKVVAVSEPIRQVLLTSGVPPEKTQVVQNGVSPSRVTLTRPEKRVLKDELGLQQDSFCILNSGRLTRQKSQSTLIEAVDLLARWGRNVELLLVGQGPLDGELKSLVTKRQLLERVHLLGFRSDVSRLLAMVDLFALPSLDEGMPMSLLEAAAAGKPIISTAVGDIPKLVLPEKTGLIVLQQDPQALAEAIMRLMDNPGLARRLGQAARAKLQTDYSSRVMAQSYEVIYQQLLGEPDAPKVSP